LTTAVSFASFFTVASARADPHLKGPHGIHFDLRGESKAIYALFETPQFLVTIRLLDTGQVAKFIGSVGIRFRKFKFIFAASQQGKAFIVDVDKQLRPYGGSATAISDHEFRLDLCPGHSVTVTRQWQAHYKIVYYDVAVLTPGCHDAYDGALGASYQCKYATGNAQFEWSQAKEDSYRLTSLFASRGAFKDDAPCHDDDEFAGMRPQSGSSLHP